MKTEKSLNPLNGYIALSVLLILCVGIIVLFINGYSLLPGLLILGWVFLAGGLVIVSPNNSKVLLLFGAYKGSIKQNGLFWVFPLFLRSSISLRVSYASLAPPTKSVIFLSAYFLASFNAPVALA